MIIIMTAKEGKQEGREGRAMEEEQRSSRRSEGRGVRIPPFLAGCFAGTVTTALLQPMDLVKTHIQANPSGAESYRAVVRQIVSRREGVRGLWRGTGPACLRVGFGAGFYFTILGPILKAFTPSSQPYTSESESKSSSSSSIEQLRKRLPFLATFSAGALSRSLAAVLVCPITVVKTRMEYEAVSGLHYSSTVKAMVLISRNEGLRGLYSGLIPTIIRDAPYSGLYLLLYNRIRLAIAGSPHFEGISQYMVNLAAGAAAGGGATFLSHPADVIRTKLQLESHCHSGVMKTAYTVIQKHGVRGLFAGIIPRAGRRALYQAISWTIYEELMRENKK